MFVFSRVGFGAAESEFVKVESSRYFVGDFDEVVTDSGKVSAAWLERRMAGFSFLVGVFVGLDEYLITVTSIF